MQAGNDLVEHAREAEAALKVENANTFGVIAAEYIDRLVKQGRSENTITKNKWYLKSLAADLCARSIREITATDILKVIKRIETSGRIETAHRVRSGISAVFRIAVSTLRADGDPHIDTRRSLHGTD